MKKINALIILISLMVSSPFFQGYATEPISFKIENSLPESKLAYYNDSFNRARVDVWGKAGYMHSEEVKADFRQAHMIIKDGK